MCSFVRGFVRRSGRRPVVPSVRGARARGTPRRFARCAPNDRCLVAFRPRLFHSVLQIHEPLLQRVRPRHQRRSLFLTLRLPRSIQHPSTLRLGLRARVSLGAQRPRVSLTRLGLLSQRVAHVRAVSTPDHSYTREIHRRVKRSGVQRRGTSRALDLRLGTRQPVGVEHARGVHGGHRRGARGETYDERTRAHIGSVKRARTVSETRASTRRASRQSRRVPAWHSIDCDFDFDSISIRFRRVRDRYRREYDSHAPTHETASAVRSVRRAPRRDIGRSARIARTAEV